MAQGRLPDGRIERERRGPSWSAIIGLVDERRMASLRHNRTLFNRIRSYYNTYRGVWDGTLNQFRNQITIPFTFAMIQSDVARKVQTSFGAWPIVTFEGYAPEDAASAQRNEILVSAQMKDADSIIRAVDFFLQADICGTAVARYGWRNITRRNRIREMQQVAPGLEVPIVREYDAEIFNGPIWEVVDRLDFWQQPARKRIDDMSWVIHRYWADWDDLMEQALAEESAGKRPYFDVAALRMLKDYPMTGMGRTEYLERRNAFRNVYDYEARSTERFSKPIEIWEMHGAVPGEMAPDGIRNRCIAVGNERVVLKNRESLMPNQAKPFLACAPMSDPYDFDGVSKAEVAFGPQRTADRLNNQKLDAVDLLIDNQWVASTRANINTQNLFSRTGRIITVDGPADDTTLRPLSPDMRNVQLGNAEIAQLFSFMQLGTGETESLLGLTASRRETARGALTRQENALTRLSLEALVIEQGFVEPLANAFRNLDRRFLTLPHQVKILGSVANINPVTGLPYPSDRVSIDADDLGPDYQARAVGASQMLGKAVRQQNFIALLQVVSANPVMLQIINWANMARQAFQLFDFPNVQDFIVSQVPAVNQVATQSGQSPEQVAAAVSQPLEQLNPETLGQLLNVQPERPLLELVGGL